MLFRTFEGQLCLTIHAPNNHPHAGESRTTDAYG